MSMRVFISHSSKDKPAVEKLARALAQRGIDPWFDKWEIGPGDDIIAQLNEGLEQADAGLIVFSKHSHESRWVEAETSYLTYARIEEGKLLIPVQAEEGAWVPPLLRPLARRSIDEFEAIADALLSRKPLRPTVRMAEYGTINSVIVTLRRINSSGIGVRVSIGGNEYASESFDALPPDVVRGRDAFLRGFHAGIRRDPAAAERAALESSIADLGRALRPLCLPDEAHDALVDLVDGGVGTTVEVCFEADDPELLGLPFEALRLKDDRLLATHPAVTMLRRPINRPKLDFQPPAGPLPYVACRERKPLIGRCYRSRA